MPRRAGWSVAQRASTISRPSAPIPRPRGRLSRREITPSERSVSSRTARSRRWRRSSSRLTTGVALISSTGLPTSHGATRRYRRVCGCRNRWASSISTRPRRLIRQSAPARGLVAADHDRPTKRLRRGTPLVDQRRGDQAGGRPPRSEGPRHRQRDEGLPAPHRIGEQRSAVAAHRREDSAEAGDLRRTQPGRRWIRSRLEAQCLSHPGCHLGPAYSKGPGGARSPAGRRPGRATQPRCSGRSAATRRSSVRALRASPRCSAARSSSSS